MIAKLIKHLVEEKYDKENYEELAEDTDDMQLKQILMAIAEQEENHYKMIYDYLINKYKEE